MTAWEAAVNGGAHRQIGRTQRPVVRAGPLIGKRGRSVSVFGRAKPRSTVRIVVLVSDSDCDGSTASLWPAGHRDESDPSVRTSPLQITEGNGRGVNDGPH